MKIQEIKKIETQLSISLPPHYKTFLMDFNGFTDNTEVDISNFLYANAEEMIKCNQRFGFYRHDKVITHKLIIGDNGGGDLYLIDLHNPRDQRIYVFDHEEFSGRVNWNALTYYDTIESYKQSLHELFGLM